MNKKILAVTMAAGMLFTAMPVYAANSPTTSVVVNNNIYITNTNSNDNQDTNTVDNHTVNNNNSTANADATATITGSGDAKKASSHSHADNGDQNQGGGSGSSGSSADNIVAGTDGLWTIGQGGKVILNGVKSNATFMVNVPDSGRVSSAKTLAASVGGQLLNVVTTTAPGVNFSTATVNFYMKGVQAGDTIAVYQLQGKKWVQIPVNEIRKDHVVVTVSQHGTLAFVMVPALATVN